MPATRTATYGDYTLTEGESGTLWLDGPGVTTRFVNDYCDLDDDDAVADCIEDALARQSESDDEETGGSTGALIIPAMQIDTSRLVSTDAPDDNGKPWRMFDPDQPA